NTPAQIRYVRRTSAPSPRRREQLPHRLRRADGHDLEVHQVAPVEYPLLQERHVVALHQLPAAVEVGLDPAIDVPQPVGHGAAVLAEPGVARLRVAPLEPLDHHEQHNPPSSAAGVAATRLRGKNGRSMKPRYVRGDSSFTPNASGSWSGQRYVPNSRSISG